MYDLIIIGAGPAGITASIYASRKMMKVLVVSSDIGGQTNWTASIENYTGYQLIKGIDLVDKFNEHLKQFKVEVADGAPVVSVEKNGASFKVNTAKAKYESQTVIVASGRTHRKLGIEGEDEFLGKGVAYCATCDAPLFKDAVVAVVGGGNSALDACVQLEKIAKQVYLIDNATDFKADPVLVGKVMRSPKIKVFRGDKIIEIMGEKFVNGVRLEQNGKIEELEVDGVFIEIGSVPASDFINSVAKNRSGEILVNCRCETSVPGMFAAGDVTDIPAKQIIVACGEGAKAALSAFSYISIK